MKIFDLMVCEKAIQQIQGKGGVRREICEKKMIFLPQTIDFHHNLSYF